jgi:predicted nucleic acid-binding protein
VKILFDTDVTLDLLLDRKPHSESAALLFTKAEQKEVKGYLCATTITTIFYLAAKVKGAQKARTFIRKLLSFLEIAPVDRAVLEGALEGNIRDFEDGVVSEAAQKVKSVAIITRNIRDYKNSTVAAYTPDEFLRILKAGN